MSSRKPHKDFLELTHTQGDARLWFTHDSDCNKPYRIILQLCAAGEWHNGRLLYRSNSFVEANAVWCHLTQQDHKVWRMTQFAWLA